MSSNLVNLPHELTSPRLLLRTYRPGDGEQYLRMVRENFQHLYEFLPHELETMQDAAGAEAFIRWQNAEFEQRNLFIFGAWEKATGKYIGEVYLANPDWHVPCVELGYFVVQSSTGKGYATEMAQAMLGYAFEHLHAARIDLQCRADNLSSQRVAKRCGFVLEGRQRLRQRKKDDRLVDRLWYGLLRDEFQA
jgi:RimJ/RimL family protein N-acetyltransferase